MKVLLLILMFICCGLALGTDLVDFKKKWINFVKKHKKIFLNPEHNEQRFKKYVEKLKAIAIHNKQNGKTYEMAENFFTDMDFDEIKNLHMGLILDKNASKKSSNVAQNYSQPIVGVGSSPFRDWRKAGAISPVINQGACGSCWAFASVGALEAYYFLKNNKSIDLSEQQLVNCVVSGCQGGWMNRAFEYVKLNGIAYEAVCPYKASTADCVLRNDNIVKCNGYVQINQGDEQHMQHVVDTIGPVVVAIDVNSNFMSYSTGVYVDSSCTTRVNHAVLVVGYGTENGQDYWLVKNSWGPEWGEKGYIRMARNKNDQCAIASYASYPLL